MFVILTTYFTPDVSDITCVDTVSAIFYCASKKVFDTSPRSIVVEAAFAVLI
jgi:hypothetical protein